MMNFDFDCRLKLKIPLPIENRVWNRLVKSIRIEAHQEDSNTGK